MISLVGLLGVVAAGCENGTSGFDADARGNVMGVARSAESKAASRGSATSPGKTLPPIGVDYSIVGEPVIGQPLEIELRTRMPVSLAALDVALSGSERLLVPAGAARMRLARMAARERDVERIYVTPLTPGRHYLSVLAEAEINGRRQARSITIPIDVGAGVDAPAAAAAVSVDAAGERIIALPARRD